MLHDHCAFLCGGYCIKLVVSLLIGRFSGYPSAISPFVDRLVSSYPATSIPARNFPSVGFTTLDATIVGNEGAAVTAGSATLLVKWCPPAPPQDNSGQIRGKGAAAVIRTTTLLYLVGDKKLNGILCHHLRSPIISRRDVATTTGPPVPLYPAHSHSTSPPPILQAHCRRCLRQQYCSGTRPSFTRTPTVIREPADTATMVLRRK